MFLTHAFRSDSWQRLREQTVVQIAVPSETTTAEAAWLDERVLSGGERQEVRRFLTPRAQHDYIVARSLVRSGLSSYFPVAPCDWRFGRDSSNKPFIKSPEGLSPIQFSLSHTEDLVALLVTLLPEGGVDVEKIKNTGDLQFVATKIFAPSELASLNRLAGNAWLTRFFQLWTLKEAYAKARGVGLAFPMKSIAFKIDSHGGLSVRFAPEGEDEPENWQFWLQPISPLCILAAAIRTKSRRPFKIFLRRVRIGASQNNPLKFVGFCKE